MVEDSSEYDITQFSFDYEDQALATRTWHRLKRVFARVNISPDDLYYVAASAVECLRNRRSDYLDTLSRGVDFASCESGATIGRVDAHFYFILARRWLSERQIQSVALARRLRTVSSCMRMAS